MLLKLFNLKLTILSIFFLFALTACDQAPVKNVKKALPHVIIETITKQDIKPKYDFIGRTEASEDVSIRSQIEGRLLKRHFAEGDDIQKGDLLFEIDPASYSNIVSQGKASLAHAKSAHRIAETRLKRGKKLVKSGAISEMEIDELSANRNQTLADVALKTAALENAKLNLSYTKIVAPISGRISRSAVSIGDLITANNVQLATLVQLEPMWVNFQISEKILNESRNNKSAENSTRPSQLDIYIEFSDDRFYKHTGKIDFIDNRVNQNTGTLAIRAAFPNPDKKLLPGQYTRIKVNFPTSTSMLLIPQAAVQEEQQGRFVLVVNNDNKVEKRMVTLGNRHNVLWEVEKGVIAGEKIIIDGLQKVQVGIEVDASEQTDIPFASTNDKSAKGVSPSKREVK